MFQHHDIDLRVLLYLSDGDLNLMGINQFGPRKKIRDAVLHLKQQLGLVPEDGEKKYEEERCFGEEGLEGRFFLENQGSIVFASDEGEIMGQKQQFRTEKAIVIRQFAASDTRVDKKVEYIKVGTHVTLKWVKSKDAFRREMMLLQTFNSRGKDVTGFDFPNYLQRRPTDVDGPNGETWSFQEEMESPFSSVIRMLACWQDPRPEDANTNHLIVYEAHQYSLFDLVQNHGVPTAGRGRPSITGLLPRWLSSTDPSPATQRPSRR